MLSNGETQTPKTHAYSTSLRQLARQIARQLSLLCFNIKFVDEIEKFHELYNYTVLYQANFKPIRASNLKIFIEY